LRCLSAVIYGIHVPAVSLNHVSVVAHDLEASMGFYQRLFALERLPTPNFGFPVQWLRVGDLQLHLFERSDSAPTYHHLAFSVDDFPALYRDARDLGAFDRHAFRHHLFELPGDIAQLYLRDPAGNLLEADAPGASGLPDEIRADMHRLADDHPQEGDNLRATLFRG
jgi:catechol 2,3-dioxygenase-like lactoylglutathione lyase family enzyme